MKSLYLGDPHIQVANLDESDDLMNFIVDVCIKYQPDQMVILGDLFHNFAVVRTEILDFWKEWLDTLSESQKLIVLTGNHDLANSGDDEYKSNALNVFGLMKKKNLSIIQNAQAQGIFGFVPYMNDQEKFIEIANGLKSYGAKVLVCHQDFDGGQYETGYYCPNGVNPDKLDFDTIIGGHIHKRQRFGKVILPGTARWMISSDANEPKGLWLVDHDDISGAILSEEFIDTSSVCSPIYEFIYRQGEIEPTLPLGARISLELIGNSDWIDKEKIKFKGKASIKTTITDEVKIEGRRATGSLEEYLISVFSSDVDKTELLKLAREIGCVG